MDVQKKIEIVFDLSDKDMKLIRKCLIFFYNDLLTCNSYQVSESDRVDYIKRIEQLEQELKLFE